MGLWWFGRNSKATIAARASLQRPYNDQIMKPYQLLEWASANVAAAHFGYCSKNDYEREQHHLEQWFHQSCTIPGTRKLHSFVPISKSNLRVSFYSTSDTSQKGRVTWDKNDLPPESIAGFASCLCDGKWWFAGRLKSAKANISSSAHTDHLVHSDIQKPMIYVLY